MFLYNTGVRISELINLLVKHINFEENSFKGKAKLKRRKRGNSITLPPNFTI